MEVSWRDKAPKTEIPVIGMVTAGKTLQTEIPVMGMVTASMRS